LGECEQKLFATSPTAPEYPILMKRRMDLMQKAYPGADTTVDRLRA
jgi:hypothetical protein